MRIFVEKIVYSVKLESNTNNKSEITHTIHKNIAHVYTLLVLITSV